MKYLYHLGVRKANNEKGQFEIETDTIIVNKLLTNEDAKIMAKKVNSDIYLEFLGTLKQPKKKTSLYYNILTKEEAVKKIYEWEPLHYDDENFEKKSKEIEVQINES